MIVCASCGADRSEDVVHDRETRGVQLLTCARCGSTDTTTAEVTTDAATPLEATVCCEHPLGRHKLTGRLYGWCYDCGRRCPEEYWVAGGLVDQVAPVTP